MAGKPNEEGAMADTAKEITKNPTVAVLVAIVVYTLMQLGVVGPAAEIKAREEEKRWAQVELRLVSIESGIEALKGGASDRFTLSAMERWTYEAEAMTGLDLPTPKGITR